MTAAFHHVELWTTDLAEAEGGWRWLLTGLGWREGHAWAAGRTWTHPDGTTTLDVLRSAAGAHGWRELIAERYPHAGGPQHTALFLENAQGFEVEVVDPDPQD